MLTRMVNGIKVDISPEEQVSIEEKWAANTKANADDEAANGWKRNRVAAYTDMGTVSDQIDIIQKQFQSMIELGEVTVLPETQAWLDAIEQIKTNNPKPGDPK